MSVATSSIGGTISRPAEFKERFQRALPGELLPDSGNISDALLAEFFIKQRAFQRIGQRGDILLTYDHTKAFRFDEPRKRIAFGGHDRQASPEVIQHAGTERERCLNVEEMGTHTDIRIE